MADILPGTLSPGQANRLEASIRRYEAEIDNITRANASLRASIRSNASPLRLSRNSDLTFSSSRYEDTSRLRISSLEDYIQTLEARLKSYERNASDPTNYQMEITRLREENVSLRDQIESLLTRVRVMGGDASRSMLEETITRLRMEITTLTEVNTQLRSEVKGWEIRYERVVAENAVMSKARIVGSSEAEMGERLRSELRSEREAHVKLRTDYRALEARYERLNTEYAELAKSKSGDQGTYQERIRSLEAEILRYKSENTELNDRLRHLQREYKDTEEDLRYRIDLLEARTGSKDLRFSTGASKETDFKYREEKSRKGYEDRHRKDRGKKERNEEQVVIPSAKQGKTGEMEGEMGTKELLLAPDEGNNPGNSRQMKEGKREKRPKSAKELGSGEGKGRRAEQEMEREEAGESLAKSGSVKSLSRSVKGKSKGSPEGKDYEAHKSGETVYHCEHCRRHHSPDRHRRSSAKERK